MAIRTPDDQGMTCAEYCLLPDDGKRYHVIDAELIVSLHSQARRSLACVRIQ